MTGIGIAKSMGRPTPRRAAGLGKLNPGLDRLLTTIGDGQAEFLVVMNEELAPGESSRAGAPDDGKLPPDAAAKQRRARALAHARRIADSQSCAIAEVQRLGGTYLQSFLLINAFAAEMTVALARVISARPDVRSVELSRQGIEPP